MSLSEIIEDHKRMILLYEKAEAEVFIDGETKDKIVELAKEFLIENSTWYAYQVKILQNSYFKVYNSYFF